MSKGRKTLQVVGDDWCSDYHCAGDCGLRGHGYQHAAVSPGYKRATLAAFDALTAEDRRGKADKVASVRRKAKDAI